MRLEWHGPPGTLEPAWVSNPDPNLFPNGVGDALYAIVDQMYGWGFSILYVTDFYADGFPRRWTVLPSQNVQVRMVDGAREYKSGEDLLDRRRVVQIDRNPGVGLTGTSALYAYAQACWGLLAARQPVDGGVAGWDSAGGGEVGAEAEQGAGGGAAGRNG